MRCWGRCRCAFLLLWACSCAVFSPAAWGDVVIVTPRVELPSVSVNVPGVGASGEKARVEAPPIVVPPVVVEVPDPTKKVGKVLEKTAEETKKIKKEVDKVVEGLPVVPIVGEKVQPSPPPVVDPRKPMVRPKVKPRPRKRPPRRGPPVRIRDNLGGGSLRVAGERGEKRGNGGNRERVRRERRVVRPKLGGAGGSVVKKPRDPGFVEFFRGLPLWMQVSAVVMGGVIATMGAVVMFSESKRDSSLMDDIFSGENGSIDSPFADEDW